MITKWLVRGDTHGQFHQMLKQLSNYDSATTAVIILGDVGFNYYFNKYDDRSKKEVNDQGYRIYCVKGNHEARPSDVCDMVLFYDEDVHGWVWWQPQYPNIRYFKEWGEYWLGCYHVAVIGGAYSVDKWWRLQRVGVFKETDWGYNNPKKTGWFPNEQLTTQEMIQAQNELHGKYYDFVLTHTCPISWQPTDLFLSAVNQSEVDTSMERWLDDFKDVIDWDVWLFGHYHQDRLERPHVEMYFNDIEGLNEIHERWLKYDEDGALDWWLSKSPNFYME
jgi:3-oxoacid CoA-transferase subunit A